MTQVRIDETWDGVCTVFIGRQIVVAGLSRSEADRLVASYRRNTEEQ